MKYFRIEKDGFGPMMWLMKQHPTEEFKDEYGSHFTAGDWHNTFDIKYPDGFRVGLFVVRSEQEIYSFWGKETIEYLLTQGFSITTVTGDVFYEDQYQLILTNMKYV